MKKFLAGILSVSMLMSATAALAAAPADYDGKAYESLGYTSQDPDGQFNLAVIANGDVKIYGNTMYIEGSVYSNGKIYVGNGQLNRIDGLFISGTGDTVIASDSNNNEWTQYRTAEGYIHVNSDGTTDGINYYSTQPEYAGAVNDTETSFDYAYEEFTVPDVGESWGDAEFNVYGNEYARNMPVTIREDAKYDAVKLNGSYGPAITVDTTNGDVNLVIGEITADSANINIKVIGDNQANIYIGSLPENIPVMVNYDNTQWPAEKDGSVENTHLYLGGDKVIIRAARIAAADIHVNTPYLEISGDSHITGDISSGADEFVLTAGQSEIYGTVFVPAADTKIVDSSTLYGQLYTDTLTINGAGRILWQADTAAAKGETKPTPEPTEAPAPKGDEVDLYGLGYAYIFGYEPGAPVDGVTPIYMAPNDSVTREQVASMLMRMIDQKNSSNRVSYQVTPNISSHKGTWYERGLAYLASKGAFVGIDKVEVGPVTRGEVAKLIAYGLNLSDTTETPFTDIADNQYKSYIEIMYAYGYMEGVSDTAFDPNRVMTRAEFCKLFNNIIGREDMDLVTADGHTVTAEDYSIVDINGHWAYETILKATSAYDKNGYVDFAMRQDNIRNKLDNYDSQMDY